MGRLEDAAPYLPPAIAAAGIAAVYLFIDDPKTARTRSHEPAELAAHLSPPEQEACRMASDQLRYMLAGATVADTATGAALSGNWIPATKYSSEVLTTWGVSEAGKRVRNEARPYELHHDFGDQRPKGNYSFHTGGAFVDAMTLTGSWIRNNAHGTTVVLTGAILIETLPLAIGTLRNCGNMHTTTQVAEGLAVGAVVFFTHETAYGEGLGYDQSFQEPYNHRFPQLGVLVVGAGAGLLVGTIAREFLSADEQLIFTGNGLAYHTSF